MDCCYPSLLIIFILCFGSANCVKIELKKERGVTHILSTRKSGDLIWSRANGSNFVECGNDIGHTILCEDNYLKIARCYCIYYDTDKNISLMSNCFSTCFHPQFGAYFKVKRLHVDNASIFNRDMCIETSQSFTYATNRTGRFCGKCKEGHGLAVYSYQIAACIPCEGYSRMNWVKYFVISLVPLTFFYILIVLFKVNLNSSYLSGPIIAVQMICSPINLILFEAWSLSNSIDRNTITIKIIAALYGSLNLDFFRDLYPPFCLSPHYNAMTIIALDYSAALYLFLLIVITYILIRLYDSNCSLVVYLWRPFKYLLNRVYKHFDSPTSLVETFANFILLSSVKISSVSMFLLLPTNTYDEFGNRYSARYLYFDSTIEWFGKEHLPYGVLAILTGFCFVIFPITLLLLYPCRCFQRFLNYFSLNSHTLRVFIDAFQGSYRLEPYDMRYLAAYSLFFRIIMLLLAFSLGSICSLCATAFFVVLNSTLTSVLHPYHDPSHNRNNSLAMSILVLFYVSTLAMLTTFYLDVHWIVIPNTFFAASQLILLSFMIYVGVRRYFRFKRNGLCWKMKHKVFSCIKRRNNLEDGSNDQLQSFSERTPLTPNHR